ncbi:DUF2157 domain-containing protein [Demequina rhizosphaerae]|uniref:DUF2157 domain-containing protein n=1 Tax=Demequina rhizosphaerae TaxID=1638985 RepID=UPI00078294BC|nr:DUF2157 domain-containing protein [Demequina rhizosphaerae]
MNGLEARIDRWVEAGLITPAVGDDLRRYEHEHQDIAPPASAPDAVATGPEAVAPPPPPSQPRTLALVGEVVGYLGAALVISAVSFLLGRTWADLPTAGRVAIVAGLLAVVAVGGTLAARVATDPAQRLASVLLLATVGLTAWLAWVITDAAGVTDEAMGVAVTAPTLVVAAVIYAARRRGLAQLATLAALAGLASSTVSLVAADDRDMALALGLTLAAVGAAWVAGAAMGWLRPATAGLVAGGMLTVLALQTTAYDVTRTPMLIAAVAVSVALLAVAITVSRLAVLIVPGGIGLLISTPQLIDHLVGDAVATWVGVLLTGVALVVVAVWMVRERRQAPGG